MRATLGRRQRKRDQRAFSVMDLGKQAIRNPRGRALVSYITHFVKLVNEHLEVGRMGWNPATLPDVLERLSTPLSSHTMHWESAEIARQLIALGFVVDYVYDRRGDVIDSVSKYDVIVDEWTNLPSWAEQNPSARKLFYATGAHWIYHNRSELTRHAWLFQRRGVQIPTFRQVPPLLGCGYCDLATSFGNSFGRSTYGPFAHKVRKLWISATDDHVDLPAKNWDGARRQFLYLGSTGWVHRGLDLVLEAFLAMPELMLTAVGSGLDANAEIHRVYGDVIRHAPNISLRGHMNVRSPEFYELASQCNGVVYPSASEGCSGAIVQCLHHGLIPIVTPIVGLEVHDTWPALQGESDDRLIEELRTKCRELAHKPESELEDLRRYFWEYARRNHTRQSYSRSLSRVLAELLNCPQVAEAGG
ncbi:MAG: glycosyltransferase [candidate division WOR-3 bacterium]|nr:glycosyltransferase [candidate division WOR-3 bacterium]